ncbi:hypothetical protein [Sphingomonas swuensis]|uniref:hypothetical protein n=1 Tax=Sphingomonas swuensis TaxID=977800 RepID=UPI0031CEEB8C
MNTKAIVERLLTFAAGSGFTLTILHFSGINGLDNYFFWVTGALLCLTLWSAVFRWRQQDMNRNV